MRPVSVDGGFLRARLPSNLSLASLRRRSLCTTLGLGGTDYQFISRKIAASKRRSSPGHRKRHDSRGLRAEELTFTAEPLPAIPAQASPGTRCNAASTAPPPG